ncbi:EAL domain-containing protein [Alphaproteobacteria bacterium GH1-50]|uniref:EAL domain-containing protein n=1 Tax=Kangsaoukella pontilimi TaxID=2691042 RepID=A0A7C9IG99_9RHOB|nr:EAL domain-containing protein [Kangsaoukella pontilimi]MXQ08204.1 EAL domain-containing protein [Kangsaoukella pontilimi]
MLASQTIQLQLAAFDRLAQTGPPDVLRQSLRGLDYSALPKGCEAGETETAGRICSPNSSRLKTSIRAAIDADDESIARATRRALWGSEAYVRALQARLYDVSNEEGTTLKDARTERLRQADFRRHNLALNRINRLLASLRESVQAPALQENDLPQIEAEIDTLVRQLELRMTGFARLVGAPETDRAAVVSATSRLETYWKPIRESRAARLESLAAFNGLMDELSSRIQAYSNDVRQSTTLWVKIYATMSVVTALLIGLMSAAFVWQARRRFVQPLSYATSKILQMASGDLGTPFSLSERAFGFDRLGAALEQLRIEMTERNALARRNEEQQEIIARNLAELERSSHEMEWLAMHDPLTELGNRRQADADLESLVRRAEETPEDYCLMQIDIDRFKEVNDALGHVAGDHILKVVASQLQQHCGKNIKCYRIGGDEFLIIYFHEVSEEELTRTARSIIESIDEPIEFDGHTCRVGASIGIALGRDADYDPASALINADLALYEVKRSGRNSFLFYTAEMASQSQDKKAISDRLLAAIDSAAFVPYYQPQYYSHSFELRGVEVLCRWYDPEHGWIPPTRFLPVAEELGVIGQIDAILFEKVVNDVERLAEVGLFLPKVSFNVTADRLLQADLAETLSKRINHGTRVAIELLESMSLDDPAESITWAIDALREQGVDIEIDDFGSHRASLAGLMAVNPQAMKIDQAIVKPITDSPRHLDLVRKIIDIGGALNIEVVAEGVETDAHVEILRSFGRIVLQGYGMARPMPFEDLLALRRMQVRMPGEHIPEARLA